MPRIFLRFGLSALLIFTAFVLPSPPPAWAQSAKLMKSYQQYLAFAKSGKYDKAIPHAQRALKLAEREFGTNSPNLIAVLKNLSGLHNTLGHHKKAEPLLKRALMISDTVLGAEHRTTRVLFNELATIYMKLGQYNAAEPLLIRILSAREKKFGPHHANVANTLSGLGLLYTHKDNYNKAEPLLKRALAIYQQTFGAASHYTGAGFNNLAFLYNSQGNYQKAEIFFKRSLGIYEKTLGMNHFNVGNNLNNLATVYKEQKRYDEAESLYKRARSIIQKTRAPDHPEVGNIVGNLAELYRLQHRYAEAEPLAKGSLAIAEKTLGANHPTVGIRVANLGLLYLEKGQYNMAESLYKRALAIRKKSLGPNHFYVGQNLEMLSGLYEKQNRYAEAMPLQKRALKIMKKALGPDHPLVGNNLNNLAFIYFRQNNWRQAATHWRQATAIVIHRSKRLTGNSSKTLTGKRKSEPSQNRIYFQSLVKSVHRHAQREKQSDEMFQTAQWAIGSEAAGALAQMSTRMGAGSGELAGLVRERQDKVSEWQGLDKQLIKARGAGRPVDKLQAQMKNIDTRIAQIDKRLATDFPNYAALASPKPLSIKQVQKLLAPDEALILLLDTPKAKPTPAETFIWAVTRDKAVWKRAELGGKTLAEKVATLRRALDPTSGTRSAKNTRGLTGTDDGQFNLAMAHELYSKLLGPVGDLIKDKKHLLVVPSGPLTALPLHVLVSQKPEAELTGHDRYRKAHWLMKRYAITTLPSVSSLKALRGIAGKGRRAKHPLIGFADPVFSKASSRNPKVASVKFEANIGFSSFFRGGQVDLAALSQLAALPDTRTELMSIAKTLNVADEHIKLGRDASEQAVKSARLDQYRIVYFATHGLVAGDIKKLSEPALAFSLPAKASKSDDGLLTASEVTQLKLNADWLVMSACNTAAGDKPGAQALSGLARAFFYAGAKTLLVSHWPVYSDAATKLTTHAFSQMSEAEKNGNTIGRAEALRRSMQALMQDTTRGDNAHPSVWAPFVVVGEGAGG